MFCALLKAIYCYYIVQLLPASEMHYCWCLKRKISLQQLHLLLFFSSRFRSLKTYRSGLQTLVKCCCWKNAEYCKNKTCLVKMAHRTCWSRYELRTLKKNSFKPKNDTMCLIIWKWNQKFKILFSSEDLTITTLICQTWKKKYRA